MNIPENVWTSAIVLGWCDSAGCQRVGHKLNKCNLAVNLDAALRSAAADAYADIANNGRSFKYCMDQVAALRGEGK